MGTSFNVSIFLFSGQNTLGPLKSRLSREKGTSNAEFSLLIAALGLNSTWTPLGEHHKAAKLTPAPPVRLTYL